MEGRILQREHSGGPGTHAPAPRGRRQCHAKSRGQTEHRTGDKWRTRCRWGNWSRTTPSDTPAEVLHLGLPSEEDEQEDDQPLLRRRYAESSEDEWEVSQDTSFPTLSLRRRNSDAATIIPDPHGGEKEIRYFCYCYSFWFLLALREINGLNN